MSDGRENGGRAAEGGTVFSIAYRRAVNQWVAVSGPDCGAKISSVLADLTTSQISRQERERYGDNGRRLRL